MRRREYAAIWRSIRWLIALLVVVPALLPAAAADPDSPRLVHRQLSVYRNIQVMDRGSERCMVFGRRNSRQTCIDLQRPGVLVQPYSHAMLAGFLVTPRPRRALVIGLGGGVIPMAMRQLDPALQIDAVELDPAVIAVAERHFGYRQDARSIAHADDGRMFVRRQLRAGQHYDMVLVDAYDENYIPEHLFTREFLQQLRELLNPGGVVVANTFADRPLQPYEDATYQSVFGPTWSLYSSSRGNRILLAARDGAPSPGTLQANARLLRGRLQRFGTSADALLQALQQDPRVTGVKPLTDQYSPANLLLQY